MVSLAIARPTMRLYLAIIGPDKDQSPALALIGSYIGPKLVTIGLSLAIIWSPLHQITASKHSQIRSHVASQPRLQLRISGSHQPGLRRLQDQQVQHNYASRRLFRLYRPIATTRLTTASQRTLQRCYCAVSRLSQRCFKTLIRGTEQIGSQPLRNMLEARYVGCYDAATCVATYSLLLPCFSLVSFCCCPI